MTATRHVDASLMDAVVVAVAGAIAFESHEYGADAACGSKADDSKAGTSRTQAAAGSVASTAMVLSGPVADGVLAAGGPSNQLIPCPLNPTHPSYLQPRCSHTCWHGQSL